MVQLSENEGIEGRIFVVTGGAGHVGSLLCLELARRGAAEVRSFDLCNSRERLSLLKRHGVQCITGLLRFNSFDTMELEAPWPVLSKDVWSKLASGMQFCFLKWKDLELAVKNEWGRCNLNERALHWEDYILRWFDEMKVRQYIDELKQLLSNNFIDQFNVWIEGDSTYQVLEQLFNLHEESSQGKHEIVHQFVVSPSQSRLVEAKSIMAPYENREESNSEEGGSNPSCQQDMNMELEVQELETPELGAQELEARKLQAQELEARELEAREQEARELEAQELEARELQAQELEARELEARELEAREVEARELEARELQAQELKARELEAREQEARELEAQELEARELQAQELEARELEAREVEAREQEARELKARELEAWILKVQKLHQEQEAREQEAREQEAQEQEAREQEARELEARELKAQELEARELEARELKARELEARKLEAWELEVHELQARELEARELDTPPPVQGSCKAALQPEKPSILTQEEIADGWHAVQRVVTQEENADEWQEVQSEEAGEVGGKNSSISVRVSKYMYRWFVR